MNRSMITVPEQADRFDAHGPGTKISVEAKGIIEALRDRD